MDTLRDIVEFESDRFTPGLPEDCQVNPGVYGAELAWWLAQALAQAGIATSYPKDEDWGWFIEFHAPSGSEFAVHCGNVDGARTRWLLSLRRHPRKMFGRDKPSWDEAAVLVAGIRAALAQVVAEGGLRWLWKRDAP